MKKLFISQPMRGKTDEEILAVRLAELMRAARYPYIFAWISVEWRLCNGEVH